MFVVHLRVVLFSDLELDFVSSFLVYSPFFIVRFVHLDGVNLQPSLCSHILLLSVEIRFTFSFSVWDGLIDSTGLSGMKVKLSTIANTITGDTATQCVFGLLSW